MAKQKKLVGTTGNGHIKTPILESESVHTEVQLKQSQQRTSIAEGSTKPVSIQEALSLLQTLCLDLRSLGCQVSILAKDNRLYLVSETPASIGKLAMKDGHITINNKPVLLG
jgi:hypothetical protein